MTLLYALIGFFSVSLIALIGAGIYYWRAKKAGGNETEEENDVESDETSIASAVVKTSDKEQWLALIDEQIIMCEGLLAEHDELAGEEDLTLQCWATYLRIERSLIESELPNEEIEALLADFQFVVDRLKHAQEIDLLLKQLSVSNDLLKQLNKVVQRTGEAVFEQMNITSNLNLRLDKLQNKLAGEADIDRQLANTRAELATLLEFGESLRRKMEEAKADKPSQDYLDVLNSFFDTIEESNFMDPMKQELDFKMSELKHLSDYQADVIKELKQKLLEAKEGKGEEHHIGQYEIAFARLEKALLESNRVIKSLEQKLDSLQAVKHDLTVDIRKREDSIKQKESQLKNAKQPSKEATNIRNVFQQEQAAMQNLAAMVDSAPLTPEYEQFSAKQSSKIEKLKQMVRESELYVEMLEQNLNKAKDQHDLLTARLSSGVSVDSSDINALTSQEMEEIENLREINHELENELARLQKELQQGESSDEDVAELQAKIADLDRKIETVQTNYVGMEERYLNALMDKEP